MYREHLQNGAAPPVPWRVASRRGKARGEFNVAAGSTRRPRTTRNGTADSNQYARRANATDGSGGGGPRAPAPLRAAELSVGRTLASVARALVPRAAPRGTRPPARKRAPPARRRGATWRGTGIAPLKGGVASRAAKWRPR